MDNLINTDLNNIITRLLIASMVHRYFLYFQIKLLKYFQNSKYLIKYLAKDISKPLIIYDLDEYELSLEILTAKGIFAGITLDRMKTGTYLVYQVGFSIIVALLLKKFYNFNIYGLIVYFIFIIVFYIFKKLCHNYLIKYLIKK